MIEIIEKTGAVGSNPNAITAQTLYPQTAAEAAWLKENGGGRLYEAKISHRTGAPRKVGDYAVNASVGRRALEAGFLIYKGSHLSGLGADGEVVCVQITHTNVVGVGNPILQQWLEDKPEVQATAIRGEEYLRRLWETGQAEWRSDYGGHTISEIRDVTHPSWFLVPGGPRPKTYIGYGRWEQA